MSFVQISASIEHGAYYYDLSTGSVYHVPHEDLLELNNVRSSNVLGGLIGGILVAAGMVGYAKNLRHGDHPLTLPLLLIVWALSSCLFYWLAKRNQKRISRLVREQYDALPGDLNLRQIMKYGRKVSIQLGIYCTALFFAAIVSWSISVTSASVLYALFSIVCFDTGVMMMTILQPIGKLLARFSMKRR